VKSGRVISNANEGTGSREMHKYQDMEYGSHQISKNWAITVYMIRNQIFNRIYVGRHLYLANRVSKKGPQIIQFPTYVQ
jgi:hypothetical protein